MTQPDLIHLVGTAAFVLAVVALCYSISCLGVEDAAHD